MNLFESIQRNLKEADSNELFHADDAVYIVGDTITKHFDLDTDIKEAYNKALDIYFIEDVVYCTALNDSKVDELKNEYNFGYIITAKLIKGPYNSEYSAIKCQSVLDSLKDEFTDKRADIINTFVNAYLGNKDAMYSLRDVITESDDKEYIADGVVVKEIVSGEDSIIQVDDDF